MEINIKYHHKYFNCGYELARFLNENNIDKECIISIYKDEHCHHIIYVEQNTYI